MAAVAHSHGDEPLDPAEAEREAVTNLTAEGHSTREVGEILGVSNATVSRDVTNVTPLDAMTNFVGAYKIETLPLPLDFPIRGEVAS